MLILYGECIMNNREDDLKNLWKELRENQELDRADEAKKEGDNNAESKSELPDNREALELDALLSRLEDLVSRLEESLGKQEDKNDKASKKDADEENGEEEEEEAPKKETFIRRRRSLRGRYDG
jgi:hypothetical protein